MIQLIGIIEIFIVLLINLGIGTISLRYFESLSWIDAFTNTCLIISTMGSCYAPKTIKGKIFMALFSVYSGLFFILIFGVLFNKFLFNKKKLITK